MPKPIPDIEMVEYIKKKYPDGLAWIDIINEWPEGYGIAEDDLKKTFYFFKLELDSKQTGEI